MDIQVVPKIGISSVVHSKHIDPDSIDVVGNDIALFDTESVISLSLLVIVFQVVAD